MPSLPSRPIDNELEVERAALARQIARFTADGDQTPTVVPSLFLYRRDAPTQPISCLYEPSVAVIVQGRKRVLTAREAHTYGSEDLLITSVDVPTTTEVIEASTERPYLSLLLKLDMQEIGQLLLDGSLPPPRQEVVASGMAIGRASVPVLRAFQRLLDLLAQPADIPILAPLALREISYRLLTGDQGARLRQMGAVGSQTRQVAKAIGWLREHFRESVRIDELAASAQMSATTLHERFKVLTAMSPLQYQKWLRLSEARRLMLTDGLDAATAAYQVGYESPSQFSREYNRQFGASPLRDVRSLRQNNNVAVA